MSKKISLGFVVRSKGEYLIGRATKKKDPSWTFFKGQPEPGEAYEEEFPRPGGVSVVGAVGAQPLGVVQEVVLGGDEVRWEAGDGEAGAGGHGDAGAGASWMAVAREDDEGTGEATEPSSVGESGGEGDKSPLPAKWPAGLLGRKLGVKLVIPANAIASCS